VDKIACSAQLCWQYSGLSAAKFHTIYIVFRFYYGFRMGSYGSKAANTV